MESKVKYLIDAALVLQATGSVAISSTTVSTKVGINRIVNGRGDVIGRYGEGSFDVLLHVVALDHTTGDETYTLNFATYDSAGANEFVHEAAVYTLGTTDVGKTLVFKFDTATLAAMDADAAEFAVKPVLAGTTPSFQYWAYLVPNKRWG